MKSIEKLGTEETGGMSRRRFLARGGAFAFAAVVTGPGLTVLSGCGGSEADNGQTNLRWSMWSASPEETEVWQGLADAVSEAHPNIKVNLEITAWQSYFDKLVTQFASNSAPDIVSTTGHRLPIFSARSIMEPLGPYIEENQDVVDYQDFFGVMREALTEEEKPYALAYDIGTLFLVYNKDLFDAEGVPYPSSTEPMTWDQFRGTAARLTRANAGQYGFVMNWYFEQLIPWLWSAGGDFMNAEETACTLDTAESRAAIQFVVDLVLKDKVAAPVTDLENDSFDSEAFYSGKIGMYEGGPFDLVNLREQSDFDWDIAPMPASKAGSITWVTGGGFGLSSATEYPEEAWQALQVITSPESLKKVGKAGRGYPARKSATSVFERPGTPPEHIDMIGKLFTGKVAQVRPLTVTTNWQEILNMLQRNYSPVFTGQQSVEETIAKVKPSFDELLQEHQQLLSDS